MYREYMLSKSLTGKIKEKKTLMCYFYKVIFFVTIESFEPESAISFIHYNLMELELFALDKFRQHLQNHLHTKLMTILFTFN